VFVEFKRLNAGFGMVQKLLFFDHEVNFHWLGAFVLRASGGAWGNTSRKLDRLLRAPRRKLLAHQYLLFELWNLISRVKGSFTGMLQLSPDGLL
jgi:hypothetical protein